MFTLGYSNSPAMFANMENFGAKYPFTLYDADGEVFDGNRPYMMRFPPGIPAKLFWSVTRYDPATVPASTTANHLPRSTRCLSPSPTPTGP
jgi:hypothetical protein